MKPLAPWLAIFRRSERWLAFAAHGLVVLMVACVAMVLRQLVERVLPGPDWSFLAVAGLLAAIEAALACRVVRYLPTFGNDALVYRGVEWVVMLIVAKMWLELRSGGLAGLLDNAAQWGVSFLENFFTVEYGVALLVVLLSWGLATIFVLDLQELEGDELIALTRQEEGGRSDRRKVHQRILERFFGVGVAIVVLAGLLGQDRLLFHADTPAGANSQGYVAAYFVLGLALLCLTNFAVLRAAWGYEGVSTPANLTVRWTGHSLVFLGLLLLVALVLPTSYALGFLPTLGVLLDLVAAALLFVVALVLTPVMLLLGWIFSLLQGGGTETEPLPPPKLPEISPALAANGGPSWLEVLRSLVFWGLFLGIILYAVSHYARQNRILADALRRLAGWRWLRETWEWLRSTWGGWHQTARVAWRAGMERLRTARRRVRPEAGGPAGWLHLRRLSPRQRVLFFYLALVRRGDDAGLPRRPGQTPLEYAQSLASGLPPDPPGVEGDLAALTQAFVEARYSRHDVPAEQASRAQRFWERLRQALRRRV